MMPAPRLLLLEDDVALQTMLDAALTSAGYAVATALPTDYLFMAQEIKPQIVIVGSDHRDSGEAIWSIGEILRATFPRLVLILLSSNTTLINEVGITARGRCFDAGVPKPFKIDQLLQVIARHYR